MIYALIIAAVLFLASLLAHELAHSLVARRNGIEVESIVLWLLGGVAQLKGEAKTPGAEAIAKKRALDRKNSQFNIITTVDPEKRETIRRAADVIADEDSTGEEAIKAVIAAKCDSLRPETLLL